MAITRIKLKRFTAFEELDFKPSPGVNAIIGANGTGKTHLMKVAYAACDVSKTGNRFPEKLVNVFRPSKLYPGRLLKRRRGRSQCSIEVSHDRLSLKTSFSNLSKVPSEIRVIGSRDWSTKPIECAYIPVKEMLANAPGFRSLYSQREIAFEEVYPDILDRAFIPPRQGPHGFKRGKLLKILRETMEGGVVSENEEFFHKSKQGKIEFTLLAEGMRKLGLLWLLLQNGTLLDGSVLFWDEPETNLNPKLFEPLINILLELQRLGVQIFLATHDYVILKELDLQKTDSDKLAFHSLYRDSISGELKCGTTDSYLNIHENTMADAFASLYDREVTRSISV